MFFNTNEVFFSREYSVVVDASCRYCRIKRAHVSLCNPKIRSQLELSRALLKLTIIL